MNIKETDILREGLQKSFDKLISKIEKIQIGNRNQLPYGWRKANKGRTVWRIVEEVITQNLERYKETFDLDNVVVADSEVGIYDLHCSLKGNPNIVYINLKTTLLNGKSQKDDISKAEKLKEFYDNLNKKTLFIVSLFLKFNDDLSIEIEKVTVFPLDWIGDIYVNPSNNGNLQSKEYKSLNNAVKRDSQKFYELLMDEIEFSNLKKSKPIGEIITHPNGKKFQKQESKRWKEITQKNH